MATIYDYINASELQSYWESLPAADQESYLGEELWRPRKQLGLDSKWIVGADGLPVVLKQSAFDAAAVPRDRIGFDSVKQQMPFFKESTYIDEELRQMLNMVLETKNQTYIDTIVTNIFDDEIRLLKGARAQRERMCMQALTVGTISMASNGQIFDLDYGIPAEHKMTVKVSWSNPEADILEDIRQAKDEVKARTGKVPTRAVCSGKTFGYFRKNKTIKESLLVLTKGEGYVTDSMIKTFVYDQLQIEIVINDLMYKDNSGVTHRFVEDEVFSMFPSGILGDMVFGTTPEESDLMGNPSLANVRIVDTGVAICTSKKIDPVDVDTKVSMITLPSFPMAKSIAIIDTVAAA